MYRVTQAYRKDSDIKTSRIHEPWKSTEAILDENKLVLGKDYPLPIVDYSEAYKAAKERLFGLRKDTKAKQSARRVYIKHGSRKRKHD